MDKLKEVKIEKLSGNNWTTWKFDVAITLKMLKCWNIVDGTLQAPTGDNVSADSKKKFEESDNLVKYVIGML